MGRLSGKVAVVSGGARGQGAAEVRLFVEQGARVVFGDILDDQGKQLASELGDDAEYVHLDVRREADWQGIVAEAETRFGQLDVLVNNAGILSMGTLTHETELEDYRRIIEVNQIGVFLGMKAAIPAMLRNHGGSIINISSTNGLAGLGGTIAYTASKFAVRGMTKNAALEYGKAGIRVNSIHPGAMDTPMIRPEGIGMSADAQAAAFAMTAIPRVGQPEEVAYMALFLASDESRYSTGAEFLVDGGMLAGAVSPQARVEPS